MYKMYNKEALTIIDWSFFSFLCQTYKLSIGSNTSLPHVNVKSQNLHTNGIVMISARPTYMRPTVLCKTF